MEGGGVGEDSITITLCDIGRSLNDVLGFQLGPNRSGEVTRVLVAFVGVLIFENLHKEKTQLSLLLFSFSLFFFFFFFWFSGAISNLICRYGKAVLREGERD